MVKIYPIDTLTIEGFQSIRRLKDFKLNALNILIGPNGAGKSNLVNYFRMLSALVEQNLQAWVHKRGGADRLLYFGVKETQQMTSRLQFGMNGYEFTLEPTDDGGLVFTEEILQGQGIDAISIGSGHLEARLKAEGHPREWRITDFVFPSIAGTSWQIYHFHDTSETAGIKRWGSLDDDAFLRADASNIAAFLYWLQYNDPTTYEQIRRTVRLAIPFFDDFVLEPRSLNSEADQLIRLNWRQRNSDYPLWPTQLSDGSLRFICLATALLQPLPPSTIIIDEPELGLHPYAITLLGSLMRSAATRTQLIVSTQSVPLLNEFDLKDLIIVERENDETIFKRLEPDDFTYWLDDYTVGELWEKNLLGGRP